METNKTDWNQIDKFIRYALVQVESFLEPEVINSVKHFLDHAEFEMAFEGLFIEIMKLDAIPKIDMVQSKKVAEQLRLNEETIFDFKFWNKFERYISVNNNQK